MIKNKVILFISGNFDFIALMVEKGGMRLLERWYAAAREVACGC